MKIFSKHRRKIEPYRRYGSREFRERVQQNKEYKRVFDPNRKKWWLRPLVYLGLNRRLFRYLWVLGAAVLLYYLLLSPQFRVTEYSFSGNAAVKTEQVNDSLNLLSESRFALIPKNSLFLLSEGRLNSHLTAEIPDIKEIRNAKRKWPNKLSFEIVERNPGFILQSNGRNFLVDESGVVVKEAGDLGTLPVVIDQITEDFVQGQALPNSKLSAFVVTMSRQWPDKISSPLAAIKIPGVAGNTAQFTSAEGWSAVFDTGRPVSGQLSNLVLILGKQIPLKDRPNLAYVDLSLEKWAYYCFKNTPCSAQPQQDVNGDANKEGASNESPKK